MFRKSARRGKRSRDSKLQLRAIFKSIAGQIKSLFYGTVSLCHSFDSSKLSLPSKESYQLNTFANFYLLGLIS